MGDHQNKVLADSRLSNLNKSLLTCSLVAKLHTVSNSGIKGKVHPKMKTLYHYLTSCDSKPVTHVLIPLLF